MPPDLPHTTPELQAVSARISNARAIWDTASDIGTIRDSFVALCHGERDAAPGEQIEIAGLPAERFGKEYQAFPVLYLHGGGFQIGSTTSHRPLISALAQAAGRTLIGVDYRLAPENRFPTALNDAYAAYRALCHTAEAVCIAGDSAGGALALSVVQKARSDGIALPRSIALISPWLDLQMTGSSYLELRSRDIFSTPEALAQMARTYAGRTGDLGDPLMSPMRMDLDDLPLTLIHAGGADITLSDSETFAARATAAGRSVKLQIWPGMFHHFQMFGELTQSRDSIREIGAFLRDAAPHST